MIEVYGNALELAKDYAVLCVTTNGTIKYNGECVMGRGIALEIARLFPQIPRILGNNILTKGNCVQYITRTPSNTSIAAFPVKHNWWEDADIALIKRSCNQLMAFLGDDSINVLLPRPGCGNGKLKWEYVKPIIAPLLDDRIHIVHWKED